jgi:hypothetical protein
MSQKTIDRARNELIEGIRAHVDAASEETLLRAFDEPSVSPFNVNADPPLAKWTTESNWLGRMRERWQAMSDAERKEYADNLLYPPPSDPRIFLSPQQYADWQAAGLIPKKPLDADASIERKRNQRKLKLAQRYLRRAKTPGAKAAAAMSVRMLEEMLKA